MDCWQSIVFCESSPISYRLGLVWRLDYLEWLGVDASWLTPRPGKTEPPVHSPIRFPPMQWPMRGALSCPDQGRTESDYLSIFHPMTRSMRCATLRVGAHSSLRFLSWQ